MTLTAIIKRVRGQVTRADGERVAINQTLDENAPIEQRTLIFATRRALVEFVRSDDAVCTVTKVAQWAFPNPSPACVCLAPISGIYTVYHEIATGTDHFPSPILYALVIRYVELGEKVQEANDNQDILGELLARLELAQIAEQLQLKAVANHRILASELAATIRTRLNSP